MDKRLCGSIAALAALASWEGISSQRTDFQEPAIASQSRVFY
jgi:hypothetical protein